MAFTRIPPDVVLFGGLTVLLVSGVLTPREALAGCANEGLATVGVLFVVVGGLTETGAIALGARYLPARVPSLRRARALVMLPTMVMSAFLNNIPVVAILLAAVHQWAERLRLSVSQLLIPLSYAAILGGTCTLWRSIGGAR